MSCHSWEPWPQKEAPLPHVLLFSSPEMCNQARSCPCPFSGTSVQTEMCFSKSISEMSWDAGRKIFSSQKACVKGLCVTSLQPWKPRGFAKLCLSAGSVPEPECFVLWHCSCGVNFLILAIKFAVFSSHRQAGEENCEWAVKISTGRGKVTALADLLATNLKIYTSGGSLGTMQNSTGAMILANVRGKGLPSAWMQRAGLNLSFHLCLRSGLLTLIFDALWLLLFIRMWFPILC